MKALGMIEVYGYLAAVEALDSALKAANVSLVDMTLVDGGLVAVFVEGDVGAVKAAMDASKTAAEHVGRIISVHVIPRPSQDINNVIKTKPLPLHGKKEDKIIPPLHDELKVDINTEVEISEKGTKEQSLISDKVSEEEQATEGTLIDKDLLTHEKMQTMTVDKLRKVARDIQISNMTRKEIRFATKNELIKSIREFIEQER